MKLRFVKFTLNEYFIPKWDSWFELHQISGFNPIQHDPAG
jgi:hypothetical protein